MFVLNEMGHFSIITKHLILLAIFSRVIKNTETWDLNTKSEFRCVFNETGSPDNLCQTSEGFTLYPVGAKEWMTSQKSSNPATGPQSALSDHYAVYNSAANTNTGHQTSLNTPFIKTAGKPVCVSFAYYMYGADLGSLYVVEKYNESEFGQRTYINPDEPVSNSSDRYENLIARGDKGKQWSTMKYQAATSSQDAVQLLFTVVRGDGVKSDIAIDNVKVDTNLTGCSLDGNWGAWSLLDTCNVQCGSGQITRRRACDSPAPKDGGQDCWKKDFTRSSSEEDVTSCSSIDCSYVIVECTENCKIMTNQVIGPTLALDNQTVNLAYMISITRDFNEFTLMFDDVTLIKADKTKIDVSANPLFDFGTAKIIVDGSSYNISFKMVNYNWTIHDNKLFKYILNYDVKRMTHNGTLKLYSAIDGNWGLWSYGKCSDKCGTGIGRRERTCDSPAPRRAGKECLKKDWTRGLLEKECLGQCYGNVDGVTVACLSGCSFKDGILTPTSIVDDMINITFKFVVDENYDSFVMTCDGKVCINVTQNNSLASSSSVYFDNKKIEQNGNKYEIILTMSKLNATVVKKRVFEYTLRYNSTIGTGRVLLTISSQVDAGGAGGGGGGAGGVTVEPVDGKYSEWESWGACTKSCGGGEQTRKRKCNKPAPAGDGKACEGPSTETGQCNTLRCPNPLAGVRREVFTPYDKSNLSDFSTVAVDMPAFPHTPTNASLLNDFKYEDSSANQKASLIRYWTYYVAKTTGVYKFHLTCSTLCNLRVSLYECAEMKDAPIKVLKGDYPISVYKSNETTVEFSMTRQYRYCVQSMHQVEKDTSKSWIQVGVTLPMRKTILLPLSVTKGAVFTAPSDGFEYVEPELVNVTYNKAVVRTYCPDLFYWTYKASVAWVRPENNSYAPLMGFSYENSTNINVTDLKAFTEQVMHITCVGEDYSIFLTDFPIFKTKQGPPTKAPVDFNVTLQPPTNMMITWGDIPEDGRSGFITGFELEFAAMDYDGKKVSSEWKKNDLKGPKMRKILFKLPGMFFKWYAFRIAGKTIAGAGKMTEYIARQTEDSIPSAPPASVSFSSPNTTSLKIIWTDIPQAQENGIITAFNISIKLNGTTEWEDHIVDPSLRQYTFHNLKKWSYYWTTIAGQTRKGQGMSSNENMFRTMEDYPDAAPTKLTLAVGGNDTLNVTWEFVGPFKYGTIIGYAISYAEHDIPFSVWKTVEVDAKTNSTKLTELNSYTRYTVKAAARSKAGIGVYTTPKIERTDEAKPETAPQNFTCFNTSSTSLRCTWLEPSPSYASGIVKGYRIFHHVYDCARAELLGTDCNETTWWFDTIVNSSQTFYDLKNLSHFTIYETQIFLYNRIGEGPKTKGFLTLTDEDIPTGKPQEVLGFPHTTSSVQLFWQPIPYGTKRGILLNYVCFYRKINDMDITSKQKVHYNKRVRRDATGYYVDNNEKYTLYDGEYMYPEEVAFIPITENKFIIGNLDLFQRYTFRLAARTSMGIGPTEDIRVNTKPGFPIVAPDLIAFDRYSLDKIKLSWNELPWNNSRGHLLNYYIIYSPVARGGEDIFHHEYTEDFKWITADFRQIELTGLTPFTKYAIRLAGVSEKGIGTLSTNPVYASTCNCPAKILTNFMMVNPYYDVTKRTMERGIAQCCEPCVNAWGKSIIEWGKDLNGNKSLKQDYTSFKKAVHDGAHLNFPIQYDTNRKTFETLPYVPILHSSEFLVFGLSGKDNKNFSDMIVGAVGSLWAYGLLILAFLLLYGIVMWMIQCNPLQLTRDNRDEFPDDFRHGAGAGVWWAVVTMFHVGYGRGIVARGVFDRIFSIPAIVFGLVLTILITSSITVQFTTYCMTGPYKDLMYKRVGVAEGSYDRYAVNRRGGWVQQWTSNSLDLYKDLYNQKIDLIAVDSYYAMAYKDTLLDQTSTALYGSYVRESSFGVVLSSGVEQLGYCLRDHIQNSGDVINATTNLDVVTNDAPSVFDVQRSNAGKPYGSYDTTGWLITILVCMGLTVISFICGSIYELYRRRKYASEIRVHEYEEAQKVYLRTGNKLVEEFRKECENKLDEIEVKHAFERIDLKIEMRKNLKFLSPNDVFKYKL